MPVIREHFKHSCKISVGQQIVQYTLFVDETRPVKLTTVSTMAEMIYSRSGAV